MGWFSAFLGTMFLRTIVGGSALLGVFYITIGAYAFAAALLLPLAGIALWLAKDLRDGGVEIPDWDD